MPPSPWLAAVSMACWMAALSSVLPSPAAFTTTACGSSGMVWNADTEAALETADTSSMAASAMAWRRA